MKKITDAADMFNKSAEIYQEKYMDVSAYSKPLNRFCDELNGSATVLELGCGPGNITRYLLDKREDLEILGSDLALEMVKLARINCPEAKFDVMDMRDLSGIDSIYDAVMVGFCLPYLTQEEVSFFFKEIAKLIKPKGIIYLSFIHNQNNGSEVKTSTSGDSVRIYYYQKVYLEKLLESNKFEVSEFFDFKENDDDEMVLIGQLK